MDIFREENKGEVRGKISSKRVIGIVVVTISLALLILGSFVKLADVSDTKLLGFFTGGMSSLLGTLFKK